MEPPRSARMRRRRPKLVAATVLLPFLLAAPSARAGGLVPEAVGSPFGVAVDAYDPETDVFDANYDLQLLPSAGSHHLAVWVRWADVGGSQNEVVGQLFDGNDAPAGPRFQVNDDGEGWQQNPAAAHNGRRVLVAWRSRVGEQESLRARLLDDRGDAISPETEISTTGSVPAVALAGTGRGIVVWTESIGTRPPYLRAVSVRGEPLGAPVQVTDVTPGRLTSDPAAGGGDRNFLVAWRSRETSGSGIRIFGRWFGPTGTALGPEFQVHQKAIPGKGVPQVAVAADGSSVVVWDVCDPEDPSFRCQVRARAYAEDGLPRGPELRVSPDDLRSHEDPAVAFDAAGNWAVAFQSCRTDTGQDRYDCRVTTVFLDPDDEPLGEPLTADPDGFPLRTSVAAVGGDFLVGWEALGCDAKGCGSALEGTYAQRYRLAAPAPPSEPPLVSTAFPGFRFWVRIGGAGATTGTRMEPACIPETLCVSGALPGRSEVFLRIVGPRPNGYLWPTIVKFTSSEVEVWIEQESTGVLRYYALEGASPGSSELPGFFDRTGFRP